jgi:hypothetical protein
MRMNNHYAAAVLLAGDRRQEVSAAGSRICGRKLVDAGT